MHFNITSASESQHNTDFGGSASRHDAANTPAPDHRAVAEACRHLHEAAARAAERAGIVGSRLVLASYDQQTPPSAKIMKFAIGDHAMMAKQAAAWSAEPGRNVYISNALLRAGLSPGKRGTAADVIGIFGITADIDADKGNALKVADLPLPPSAVLITSTTTGAANWQVRYLFDRAITLDEAKPIASAICDCVGDADGGSRDAAHLWRLAGTLNWPKPAKLARGRSAVPELVVNDPAAGPLRASLTVQQLVDAFEVEQPSPADGQPSASNAGADDNQPKPGADRWNGNPQEIARYEDAQSRLDANNRDVWLKSGAAWHHYSSGASWGRSIWERWAASSSKYDAQESPQVWRSFHDETAKPITMGTVVRSAQDRGWDASRKRFKLSTIKGSERPLDASAQRVVDAAAAFPDGALFHQARESHLRHFLFHTRSLQQARMLSILTGFVSFERRFAWPGYRRLTARMSEVEPCSLESARKIAAAVAMSGYIVVSPARFVNGTGHKGPSFALLPPPGMTWSDLLAWDRRGFGHDEGTAWPIDEAAGDPIEHPIGGTFEGGGGDPSEHPVDNPLKGVGGGPTSRGRPAATTRTSTRWEEGGAQQRQQGTTQQPGPQMANPDQLPKADLSGTTPHQSNGPRQGTTTRDPSQWASSPAMPDWLRAAMAACRSQQRCDLLTEKLNRAARTGLTDTGIHGILDAAAWSSRERKVGSVAAPANQVRFATEALTEALGKQGHDLADWQLLQSQRADRKANSERFKQGAAKPAQHANTSYTAAKNGECVDPDCPF